MADLILTGVKPDDLEKLPQPVRCKTVGSETLTWIAVEDRDVDQYAEYGTAWYLWTTHYVGGHERELTMRCITPALPYFVTKVDFVSLPAWGCRDVPLEEWKAQGLMPAVLRWTDWLTLAPIIGTVLDEHTVLVHDNPSEEAWADLYQKARALTIDKMPSGRQLAGQTDEWTHQKNSQLDEEAKRVLPTVQARLESLPPEFTEDLKTALTGAEMMFRVQGGCAPVMEVWTTEDGTFWSPLPNDVQSYQEILQHMRALLTAKPGVTTVYFSFTSAPQAGRSDTLNCFLMTHRCLYEMQAEITGGRSLGEWTLETIYPDEGDHDNG